MKQYDIITIGSGLVDASLPTEITERNSKICIPIGSKIPIKKITFSSGGGGINTATCIARLGLKAGFLGKIGSGYNGQIILRELKKNKVDFLGVKSKEHTGYSIILKTTSNRRSILTYKGASNNLKSSKVNFNKLKTKWFHLTSMDDESFKTQKKIVDYAIKNKIKISFNPGIERIKKGYKNLAPLIKHADFLSMNKEEAKSLLKTNSNKDLSKKLHKLGAKIVCVTNGNKEGEVFDGNYFYCFKPRKVKVKECTGAGDAFASSFIVGLIKFKSIETAIKLALINSQSIIKHNGATGGILTMKEALKIMKNSHFKIKKENC